jgi:formylglycine-generating enzyme required for sulfatase activity
MGNPLAIDATFRGESNRVRLVTLAPFYLDATETTVKSFRPAANSNPFIGFWTGSTAGTSLGDWCTLTPAPSKFEGYPVNCVPWDAARNYCVALGKDLPTEAQFEYASSGLESRLYVWGTDPPTCSDAVWGRESNGILAIGTPCPGPDPHGGPAPVGSGQRDRLDLSGGTVVDLGGNVVEWALDDWNRQVEPCWSKLGVYSDPVCTHPSPADGLLHSFRGGTWLGAASTVEASARGKAATEGVSPEVGFRCARRAAP